MSACIIPEKRETRCHFCGKRIHWEIPEDIREGLTEEMLAEGADYYVRGPLNPDGSFHVGTCTFRRSPLSAAPASQAEEPSRRAR